MGIMNTRQALESAREKGLDLVVVSLASSPPVCKVMDYGRHRYEQDKKKREARKKSSGNTLKEITLSYKIESHDYEVRLKRLKKFLEAGSKVKMTIRLRGREAQHSSLGTQLLDRFADAVSDISTYERRPKLEGRRIIMILTPKKA